MKLKQIKTNNMKKNIFLSALMLLTAGLAFTGCSTEDDITNSSLQKEYTLTGGMGALTDGNAATRMYHSSTPTGNFLWSSGDIIDAWDTNGKYIGTLSIVTGADNNSGTFTGNLTGVPAFVTYPHNTTATYTVGTTSSVSLTGVPRGVTNPNGGTVPQSVADIKNANNMILAWSPVTNNTFTLQHKLAYVYFNFETANGHFGSNDDYNKYGHVYLTGTVGANGYTLDAKTGNVTPSATPDYVNVWENPGVSVMAPGGSMTNLSLHYGTASTPWWSTNNPSYLVTNAKAGNIYCYTGEVGGWTITTNFEGGGTIVSYKYQGNNETVTGNQTHTSLSGTMECTAQIDPGYVFLGWFKNGATTNDGYTETHGFNFNSGYEGTYVAKFEPTCSTAATKAFSNGFMAVVGATYTFTTSASKNNTFSITVNSANSATLSSNSTKTTPTFTISNGLLIITGPTGTDAITTCASNSSLCNNTAYESTMQAKCNATCGFSVNSITAVASTTGCQ
jgi:hypothetical protein